MGFHFLSVELFISLGIFFEEYAKIYFYIYNVALMIEVKRI